MRPEAQDTKAMQHLKTIGDVVCGIFALALFALLFWLILVATPDQFSAECEFLREEMEAGKGKRFLAD